MEKVRSVFRTSDFIYNGQRTTDNGQLTTDFFALTLKKKLTSVAKVGTKSAY